MPFPLTKRAAHRAAHSAARRARAALTARATRRVAFLLEARRRRSHVRRLRLELASYSTGGERSELAAVLTRHAPADLAVLTRLTGRSWAA